jgi:hypothetical protein
MERRSAPPLYLALSELARHLIEMLARDDLASFPAIFAVIEHWLVEGVPYVVEAATVGLLEDLQKQRLAQVNRTRAVPPISVAGVRQVVGQAQ